MTEPVDLIGGDISAVEGSNAVGRRSIGLLIANVIGNAGFFVGALILARSLGPSGRGVMAFFVVSALLGSRLVSLGINDAAAVFAAKYPERRAAVLCNAALVGTVSGILGGGLFVCVLALVKTLLPKGVDSTMLALLVGGICASTLSTGATGYLRGCGRFRAYGLITAMMPWLYALGLVGIWVGPGIDVRRAAAVWLGFAVVTAIVSLVAAIRVDGLAKPERRLVRESMAFGVRGWVGSLAGILNARVDQIIIGLITTEAVLGLYSVSVNVSEVLLYLPNATATALLPAILQSAPEFRLAQTLMVFRRLTVMTFIGVVAAMCVGVPLIPIVFGSAFKGSTLPFVILLPGGLGYGALVVAEAALYAAGSPGRASLGVVVALCVGVVLDLILVPPYGASGAAIAATAAFAAGGAAGMAFFRRTSPFFWRDARPGRSDFVAVIRAARSITRPLSLIRT